VEYPPSICIAATDLPESPSAQAEEVAMRVITHLLDARIDRTDLRGGPTGLHDFDATVGSRTLAFEVTACIDSTLARFFAVPDRDAIHWGVEGLRRSWVLRLDESTMLRGLIEVLAPLLRQLEDAGVTGLGKPRIDDFETFIRYEEGSTAEVAPSVIEACFAAGIDTAWAIVREADEQVVVFERRSRHGSGRTEYMVTEEVNRAARAKADVLGREAARRRDAAHLFVWLDPNLCREGIEFAMWSGYPSAAPRPILPESIDHVWVAMWSLTPGEGIGYVNVWEASRDGEWRYAIPHSA
jgi:hypothetical protein